MIMHLYLHIAENKKSIRVLLTFIILWGKQLLLINYLNIFIAYLSILIFIIPTQYSFPEMSCEGLLQEHQINI